MSNLYLPPAHWLLHGSGGADCIYKCSEAMAMESRIKQLKMELEVANAQIRLLQSTLRLADKMLENIPPQPAPQPEEKGGA